MVIMNPFCKDCREGVTHTHQTEVEISYVAPPEKTYTLAEIKAAYHKSYHPNSFWDDLEQELEKGE